MNGLVMIAVPTRGQVQWQTVERLTEIHDASGSPVVYVQGGLSVAQTRNRIVRRFLESENDYLLMVDDDIVPPIDVLKLFDRPVEMGPVALPYVMWHPEQGFYLSVYHDIVHGIQPRGLEDGLNMVDVAGTGCMMFHRSLFATLPPHPFRFSNVPGEEGFSEDILFCRDVRAAGLDVMAWWDGSYCDHAKLMGLAHGFAKQQA